MRASFASFTYKRFLGSVIRAAKQLTYTECFPPKKEHQHQTGKKHSNRQDAGHLIVSTIGWQKVAIRLWLWRDAGHQSDVDVVQWHPNSHYVATGSSDRSIRLWDIRDASIARVFVGHRSPVSHPAALSLMQITCRNAICNVCLGPSVTSVTGNFMTSHAALCRQAFCLGLASCLHGQTMHSLCGSLPSVAYQHGC